MDKIAIFCSASDNIDPVYFDKAQMCIRDREILLRFIFPLGTYTKQEVREYLRQKGFETKAQGGESMEICFIE